MFSGLSSVQEVWGRGQTWRLTQMWYRPQFFAGALDLKLGRLGVNEDFNSFPCDFQSLAFCSAPIGNVAGDVWFSGPVSQWGLRARYNIDAQWAVQIGVYEQNPSNLEIGNGFKLSGSGTKGALVPVEVIWKPTLGSEALRCMECLDRPQDPFAGLAAPGRDGAGCGARRCENQASSATGYANAGWRGEYGIRAGVLCRDSGLLASGQRLEAGLDGSDHTVTALVFSVI
jgi:carbohydrate-selective porin OprB